jgi:NPCBM/NEW2 domain
VMLKIKGTPIGFDYVSDLPWDYQNNGVGVPEKDMSNGYNRIRDGKPLTLRRRVFAKGIGVSAPSDLGIRLDRQYARFTADIGMDDESGGEDSIVFRVLLDGVVVFDSGAMTHDSAAGKIDLNVVGKTEMRLRVMDTGNQKQHGHGDWAGAKLLLVR